MSDSTLVTSRRAGDVHHGPEASWRAAEDPLPIDWGGFADALEAVTQAASGAFVELVVGVQAAVDQIVTGFHDMAWRMLPLEKRLDIIFAEGEARIMARIDAAWEQAKGV